MTELIREQLILLSITIYIGLIMGFVYDLLIIWRIAVREKKITVWIQDIIYGIVCAYFFYQLLLEYNYGIIRIYSIVGMLSGIALYNVYFSRYVRYIIGKCSKMCIWILKKLCKPFKIMINKRAYGMKRKMMIWRRKHIEELRKEEARRQEELVKEVNREEETTT